MTQARLVIFEDDLWEHFTPLSHTSPLFDIKTGCLSILESYDNPPQTLLVRDKLANITAERHPGYEVNPDKTERDTLFIHSAVLPSSLKASQLDQITGTFAIVNEGRVLVARLSSADGERIAESARSGKRILPSRLKVDRVITLEEAEDAPKILLRPWAIIANLEHTLPLQISASITASQTHRDLFAGPETMSGISIKGEHRALVSRSAVIEEGTVLDCSKGPVIIGAGAYVCPSRIVGPAFIGERTQVKQFSIVSSSYIGKDCRIAGEIEDSIVCDYTNKAHLGFLGHSYVGSWINIGASTTTSDLKMTYGNIKMVSGGSKTDTGLNKLGSFIGDMAKTSIGCLIYSGARIGVSSHLHGLISGDVPSFTIAGRSIGSADVELKLESAIETQRKMMLRRGLTMSKAFEAMIESTFRDTMPDRRKARVRRAKFVSP